MVPFCPTAGSGFSLPHAGQPCPRVRRWGHPAQSPRPNSAPSAPDNRSPQQPHTALNPDNQSAHPLSPFRTPASNPEARHHEPLPAGIPRSGRQGDRSGLSTPGLRGSHPRYPDPSAAHEVEHGPDTRQPVIPGEGTDRSALLLESVYLRAALPLHGEVRTALLP